MSDLAQLPLFGAPTVYPRPRVKLPKYPSAEQLAQMALSRFVLTRDEPFPLCKSAQYFGRCYAAILQARAKELGLVSYVDNDPENVKAHHGAGGQALAAFSARTLLGPTLDIEPATIWNFKLYDGLTLALNHDVAGRAIYNADRYEAHKAQGKARPDIWVVLKGILPCLFFAGWTWDHELLATTPRILDPKYSPAYVLDEVQLYDTLEIVVPVGVR